jgi:hypothetical protein
MKNIQQPNAELPNSFWLEAKLARLEKEIKNQQRNSARLTFFYKPVV